MRLSAVPLFFAYCDVSAVRKEAYASSLSTHPGAMAAEACSFMAAFIASALVTQDRASAAQFLDKFVDGYLTLLRDETTDFNTGQLLSETSSSSIKAKETMVRLLESSEPEGSTER